MPTYEIAADDLDRYCTIAEAAARLRIGRSTAYEMIADKRWASDLPDVPVITVGGRRVVSLRLLVAHIHTMHDDPIVGGEREVS